MGCTNQKSTSVKEYKKKLDNKEVSKIIDDIELIKKIPSRTKILFI